MDILQLLKRKTSHAHQQMERAPLFNKIITKEISLGEYILLLSMIYAYIKPCEAIITKKYPDLISGREKIPLLQLDLNNDIEMTSCTEIPKFENEAHCYGYLYVIEGSTLGGQVISKCLQQNEILPPNLVPHYFNAYGRQTKTKWTIFTEQLHHKFNASNEINNVIDNAIETFMTLSKWLQQSSRE